jgi:hypothetical protein
MRRLCLSAAFLLCATPTLANAAPSEGLLTTTGLATAGSGLAYRGETLVSAPARVRALPEQADRSPVIRASFSPVAPATAASEVRLAYAFRGWSDGHARIEIRAEHPGGHARLDEVRLKQGPDASTLLEALGVTLRLTATGPKNKDALVEVVAPAVSIAPSPY